MYDMSAQLKQYHQRRNYYIFLMGNRCSVCKSIDDLEFDHVDPSSKIATISSLLASSASSEVLEVELRKCQLLCGRCHQEKTRRENGGAEHGSGGMFRHHGCRCELCVAYNRNYTREYYQRRMAINSNYRREQREKAKERKIGD